MTIDGYIARKNGNVDFLDDVNPLFNEEFTKFVNSVDTIIMGSGTYKKLLDFGEIPFVDKKIYVLTSKNSPSNQENIIFTSEKIEDILKKENNNIWLFGGSKVIQSFINLDLIDEFQLYIVPKIIGDGIPLFLENNGLSNLELCKHNPYDNDIMLVYKKI
jgi:dihydrofolate reductase